MGVRDVITAGLARENWADGGLIRSGNWTGHRKKRLIRPSCRLSWDEPVGRLSRWKRRSRGVNPIVTITIIKLRVKVQGL